MEQPKKREHLKKLRLELGYTQQQVADFLGVTKATISKYENGQRKLNTDHVEKLGLLYNVEPLYILCGITSAEWEKKTQERVDSSMQKEREYWESALLTDTAKEIISFLDLLNEDGQSKALERVAELTEIPKYQAYR